MAVDREWLAANLGVADPASAPAQPPAPQDPGLARILFDPEGPEAQRQRSDWPTPPPTLAKAFVQIPWPANLAPKPSATAPAGDSLPPCDVLIVTWTLAEALALSHVLTPGSTGRSRVRRTRRSPA